jgi:chromosome segregation ATPase
MKPQVKKILTKLSQEDNRLELSEAKAKALLKDFTKAEQQMNESLKSLRKLESKINEARDLKQKADQEVKAAYNAMGIYKKSSDEFDTVLFDDYKRKADDLGINVNTIPIISQINRAYDAAADAYRPLGAIASTINKFVEGR